MPTTFPVMERATTALSLAGVSGLLNAWTFGNAGSFATVQSGNLIVLGYSFAEGDWSRLLGVALSIVAFTLGACLCAIAIGLFQRARRSYSAWVLAAEILLLLAAAGVFLLWGGSAMVVAMLISFVAGAQGNAFHRETGMLYGNVAVTFVLQSVGSLLGRALISRVAPDGEHHLRPAAAYLLVLAGFSAGGAIGFLLSLIGPAVALFAACALLAALAVADVLARGAVDPGQNNPTP